MFSKKSLIIGLLVLFALLAVGGGLIYRARFGPVSKAQHEKVMQQAQALAYEQKYSEIEALLNKHLQQRLTNDARYDTQIRLATNYQNQKQDTKALAMYQEADTANPDKLVFDIAIAISSLAIEKDDTKLALDYYQRAVEIALHDTDIGNDMYVRGLRKIISKLKKGEKINTESSVDSTKLPANYPKELLGQ